MSWDKLVIVTDSDLARFEPEATHTDQPWGSSSWPTQIEQAKRTLRHWIDADYASIVGASDRLQDRYTFEEAKRVIVTGGTPTWTDIATEFADPDEEDINLATAFTTPASDFIYVANRWAAQGIFVHLLDSVNANASTLTVSYWADNQWQAVPSQSDGTAVSGATFGQSGRVTWTRITDWERRSLDGSDENFYWLRLKVDNALTAGTSVSQLMALRHPEGLRSVASMLALGYIMRGMAAQMDGPWIERAESYLDDAKALYDRLRLTGGIPLDTDASGGIEPSETGTGAIVALGRMPRA